MRITAGNERPRQRRIELERLAIVGDGAIEVAAPRMDHSAIVVGLGVAWIEVDGLVEIRRGAIVVADFRVGVASVVVGLREAFRRTWLRRTAEL